MSGRAAVFFDRDGVLNHDVGYITHLDDYELLPRSAAAVRRVNEAGLLVFVATNQAGAARGYFPESMIGRVHEKLREELERKGARLDALYFCPYLPGSVIPALDKDSDLRKPKPGMLLKAASEHGVDMAASYMIGDKYSDLECGWAAGCKGGVCSDRLRPGGARPLRGHLAPPARYPRRGRLSRGRADPRRKRGGTMSHPFGDYIEKFPSLRVAVAGDFIADEFIHGDTSRISREAPVIVLDFQSREILPGGGGNAAMNAAALDGGVSAIGALGADTIGGELKRVLSDGKVGVEGLIQDGGRLTPTKMRVMAGGRHTSRQQVIRGGPRTAGPAEREARKGGPVGS